MSTSSFDEATDDIFTQIYASAYNNHAKYSSPTTTAPSSTSLVISWSRHLLSLLLSWPVIFTLLPPLALVLFLRIPETRFTELRERYDDWTPRQPWLLDLETWAEETWVRWRWTPFWDWVGRGLREIRGWWDWGWRNGVGIAVLGVLGWAAVKQWERRDVGGEEVVWADGVRRLEGRMVALLQPSSGRVDGEVISLPTVMTGCGTVSLPLSTGRVDEDVIRVQTSTVERVQEVTQVVTVWETQQTTATEYVGLNNTHVAGTTPERRPLDGRDLVWCRTCQQLHCCELPY